MSLPTWPANTTPRIYSGAMITNGVSTVMMPADRRRAVLQRARQPLVHRIQQERKHRRPADERPGAAA